MSDLCPEDKAKIGELVKKLAGQTKQKLEHQRKFDDEKKQMEAKIRELEMNQSKIDQER